MNLFELYMVYVALPILIIGPLGLVIIMLKPQSHYYRDLLEKQLFSDFPKKPHLHIVD